MRTLTLEELGLFLSASVSVASEGRNVMIDAGSQFRSTCEKNSVFEEILIEDQLENFNKAVNKLVKLQKEINKCQM